MRNNSIPRPEVQKMSKLIDAIRAYAISSARTHYEEHLTDTYDPPCLASWDDLAWLELIQDWDIVDYIVSGTKEAKRLLRSLQACLHWYGQEEIHEIHERIRVMSIMN